MSDFAAQWPYVRAGVITLALFSQCVSALPDRPLNVEKLERPEGRRALRWLGAALRPFGMREQADVQRLVINQSERLVAVRAWLLRPVAPLTDAGAMRQQWRLFLNARDQVYRLRIDAQTQDGTWSVVYRTHQEDALGLAPTLDYRRLRGVYNPGKDGPRGQYEAFARWLMTRIWTQHPEYAALRVGMERIHVAGRERPAELLGTDFVIEQTRPEQL